MTSAFQSSAFQNNAFQIDGGPVPVVVIDTHDDGRRFKKRMASERAAREARRNDLIAAYELLVEGRPEVAAEVVQDFTEAPVLNTARPPPRPQVDWSALLDRAEAIDRLWAAFIDMDDEEVLLLI